MNETYLVWRPEDGQSRDDARRITAGDAEQAAACWARWYDSYSADYLIVGGTPAGVAVERPDGEVEHFIVMGEPVPVYRARPLVARN